MRTLYFRALWGMSEGRDLREKLAIIRDAGYDGFEGDTNIAEPAAIRDLCAEFGLRYIAQIFPLTPAEHRAQATRARDAGAIRIDAHSGRDRWSFEEGAAFWREVLPFENDLGIPVGHETHRYRMFYSPWSTARYLEAFPEIRVTLDLSHWCCVCETMLDDMMDFVEPTIARAVHLHARVGHEEGPQVPDPSAPEWARHLEKHAQWWDTLRARHLAEDAPYMTITPEFGPPHYQWTKPRTGEPLADLAKINLWTRDFLKERFAAPLATP